ncbi:MAG: LON peptidase substrate-binding domain-containing protein [Alphaproteobacteria bacterium]|nr:LON peptidase substrate-binding domain-containing protein [Alphaproteobacteria bacterium]
MLPIFPLPGVLLLPRGRLPLRIFEPRYLAMTRDALAGERLIGMVQPSDPAALDTNPPVYPVGCAGRITSFTETEEGLFLITLTGISRFRIREELPLLEGYRRVAPEWHEFARDLDSEEEPSFDREHLMGGLRAYFQQQQISADWDAIASVPSNRLVTSIAMMCPFEPSEKQALLEASGPNERARLLTAIVDMAVFNRSNDSASARH